MSFSNRGARSEPVRMKSSFGERGDKGGLGVADTSQKERSEKLSDIPPERRVLPERGVRGKAGNKKDGIGTTLQWAGL